jgi:two-component system NtrC family sensor kinase
VTGTKQPDKRKILVIDDNPDIHRDFANILGPTKDTSLLDQLESEIFGDKESNHPIGSYHYELHNATQGKEALRMITQAMGAANPFQLAFVDMRMPPGWDGLETIERLWQADPQLQVVLCTAYSDYSWPEIQQRLGQTANMLILKKPFDTSEVAQMAAALTEKWILSKKASLKQGSLESLVQKRTSELQETNRRLKNEIETREKLEKDLLRAQKMEAIGTLAAGVAHDLNNILSGIVSYPDLLLMEVDETNPMHDKLKLIQQSGEKAAAIVQDMLTLGRRGVVNHTPVDVKGVIDDFMHSTGFTSIKRQYPGVRFEIQIENGSKLVQGSGFQLEKCLENLLANAAQAHQEGGTVTIELRDRYLKAPYDGYSHIPKGNYLVMSVTDNGAGIDETDLEHIFEPFYTKKKMGRSGTGLGLAVVWGVMLDHKGYIDVISRKEEGTRFDLYLPSAVKTDEDENKSVLQSSQEEVKASVLVVDDVTEQREVAVALLQALGYRAEAVPSGEEAIEFLKKRPVDLLLLDMAMEPGIDGLETYKRALAINSEQRAIIASGYTKSDKVEKALAIGGSGFLKKPYRLDDLADSVIDALK